MNRSQEEIEEGDEGERVDRDQVHKIVAHSVVGLPISSKITTSDQRTE